MHRSIQLAAGMTPPGRFVRPRRALGCIVATLALAACDQECIDTFGTSLRSRLTPHDTTLNVGQSFVVRAVNDNQSCHGAAWDTLAASHDIRASDTAVVKLDTLTGRVTARAVGDAVVDVLGVGGVLDVTDPGAVQIHVR